MMEWMVSVSYTHLDVYKRQKKYSAVGREEVKKYVMSKMKVCGSVGKA